MTDEVRGQLGEGLEEILFLYESKKPMTWRTQVNLRWVTHLLGTSVSPQINRWV